MAKNKKQKAAVNSVLNFNKGNQAMPPNRSNIRINNKNFTNISKKK